MNFIIKLDFTMIHSNHSQVKIVSQMKKHYCVSQNNLL